MHIPDGFVDAKTAVVTAGLAVAGLGLALRSVRRTVPPRQVPLIGLAAAFVFAAQMLNFPVAGGTSGHLIGAVLVTVLLGLSSAVVVMSSVLILQCFLFADGGVTALGANLFNMAIMAPVVGYGVYVGLRRLTGDGPRSRLFATAFAAWASTVMASLACAGELAWSGTVAARVGFPAMVGVHVLIGAGEALITTLVVASVTQLRPELALAERRAAPEVRYRDLAGYGLLVALGLTVFVAPFACGWPDGLEKVAETLGFAHRAAAAPVWAAPLPDYTVPGLSGVASSTIIAGGIGTLVAFALSLLLAWWLTPAVKASAGPGGSVRGAS